MKKLKYNYNIWLFTLLSLLTLGIYSLIPRTTIGCNINKIASKYDNKKTMNFCLIVFLISPITLSIGMFIWFHRLSNRISNELKRRNIEYDFSAKDFWLWNVLGSFIFVGPLVYLDKLFKANKLLCEDYNKEIE